MDSLVPYWPTRVGVYMFACHSLSVCPSSFPSSQELFWLISCAIWPNAYQNWCMVHLLKILCHIPKVCHCDLYFDLT